jgi:serine/threonine-protein kinase
MRERRAVLTGIPFGKYQLVKRLARGGMAEVFLARQSGPEGFNRMVAVKRILPHLVDSQDFVRMFLDEARLAAQLSHPNVVHIYDFGKVDEHYFIAMEYVDGVHAGDLIRRAESERLPDVLVARIGADACAGLHYAHELRESEGRALQVVHRDVSPPNLLASYDGAVKLVDFGIAKAVSSIDETRPGVVKGKFAYMSPEQTIGQKLDGRSDVFSLAVVLWELLVGRVMVPRQDPVEGMRMIRDGRVPPIIDERPDLPPPLGAALDRALQARREDRCTALELGRALEEFIKQSKEGIGSALELAEWVRQRFPRDGQSGSHQALDDLVVGTRPATRATHAALPVADGSAEMPALPMTPAMAPGPRSNPAVRATSHDLTSARVAALPRAASATVDESSEWEAPPARATRVGHLRARGQVDDSSPFDAESSSVIVAPDWMVEDESGPAFDTVAEGSGGDTVEVEREAETEADTHDFQRPQFDTDTFITRVIEQTDLGSDPIKPVTSTVTAAARPGPALAGKIARVVVVLTAGTAIGVGTTLLLRHLSAREPAPAEEAAVDPAPAATPPRTEPAPVEPAPGTPQPDPPPATDPAAGPSPTAAFIEIVTVPAGARVSLGDLPSVDSPAQFPELAAGTYPLRISERGFEPMDRTIEVAAGERRTITLELVAERKTGGDRKRPERAPQPPASGVLKVRTRPYSDVYLDGHRLGQTPLVTELKPGRYTLVFKHPGRPSQRKTITVRGGDETKLDFALD